MQTLKMPEDFDMVCYEAIRSRVKGRLQILQASRSAFVGAWNAVGYRFLACTEHDEAFTDSIRKYGDAPPPRERYVQERELFGFFVSGLSVLESFSYGLFAIASMVQPANFLITDKKDLRFVSLKKMAARFDLHFPAESISSILLQITESSEFKAWRDARNRLIHRAAPGRLVYASVGGPPQSQSAEWKGDVSLTIDEHTTSTRRTWLARNLGELFRETDVFTNKYL